MVYTTITMYFTQERSLSVSIWAGGGNFATENVEFTVTKSQDGQTQTQTLGRKGQTTKEEKSVEMYVSDSSILSEQLSMGLTYRKADGKITFDISTKDVLNGAVHRNITSGTGSITAIEKGKSFRIHAQSEREALKGIKTKTEFNGTVQKTGGEVLKPRGDEIDFSEFGSALGGMLE